LDFQSTKKDQGYEKKAWTPSKIKGMKDKKLARKGYWHFFILWSHHA